MSRVDTSIGFSLRSEPPSISAGINCIRPDLNKWILSRFRIRSLPLIGALLGFLLAHLVIEYRRRDWSNWVRFLPVALQIVATGVLLFGTVLILQFALLKRLARRIRAAGFDSSVIHLTAEGQWVTFRFASGHEFVDRWDRLLRFKSAPEFTEFEFPANPPIIIPTMAIPVETLRTISLFCAAEKFPSETKR